ncbi:DUF397 domain-containing protein [Actinoallomurus rhizosphaericola]|uniref:DUF397 domain-containing protein n=1 Tax=Actinoallomurus rhizosphaericola TaxID=2952536 RepID=UPI00209197CF|nr:DUF397 domain-containing protein [Actinoallomurus rhizosphaericola]MCO5993978.1 DUF397 domain-containing protein [Actinoallomurus rhizosphaericola]
MTTFYPPDPSWRTSSYSADQGGTCVQVTALWRTSSHSGSQGGECVQVAALSSGPVRR